LSLKVAFKKKAPAGAGASLVSITSIAVGMKLLGTAYLVYLIEYKRFEDLTGKYRANKSRFLGFARESQQDRQSPVDVDARLRVELAVLWK
jgi:hypothetical protein